MPSVNNDRPVLRELSTDLTTRLKLEQVAYERRTNGVGPLVREIIAEINLNPSAYATDPGSFPPPERQRVAFLIHDKEWEEFAESAWASRSSRSKMLRQYVITEFAKVKVEVPT